MKMKEFGLKLFHFYRIFKNGRGRGSRGQSLDPPVLNDLAYAIKVVSLNRTVSSIHRPFFPSFFVRGI